MADCVCVLQGTLSSELSSVVELSRIVRWRGTPLTYPFLFFLYRLIILDDEILYLFSICNQDQNESICLMAHSIFMQFRQAGVGSTDRRKKGDTARLDTLPSEELCPLVARVKRRRPTRQIRMGTDSLPISQRKNVRWIYRSSGRVSK